jgi:mono/diheme cytochrome c family protein
MPAAVRKLSKSERSDEFMIERIKKGKVGAMPAFGAVFNDAQIGALMAYIRGSMTSSLPVVRYAAGLVAADALVCARLCPLAGKPSSSAAR